MRGIPFVGLSLVVACGLLVAATPPTSATVRTDVVDETFVNLYLKWKDGHGTLSWSPEAPTEDDVSSPYNQASGIDEFIGAPAPRALYINASKPTQVDLFSKSTTSAPDVEVWVGTEFYGGGARSFTDVILYGDSKTCSRCADTSLRPTAPGYKTFSHRLAAELDVIPQGAIITLRIRVEYATYVYGLSGEHGSVLRFPTFSPDEVLYRVPKYQREAQPQGPPIVPSGVVDDLVSRLLNGGALGFASFGALGRRRRDSTTLLVPALFAAGALAGCVGTPSGSQEGAKDEPPGLGGSASSYLVPDEKNETGFTTAERGSIFGVVTDPEGLPVNGAFAALLGRTESRRTDPYGRFHFNALAPGSYELHVDRDGFLPLETSVTVEAASITKVDIVLEYASQKDRDHRPHRHDYWFDAQGRPVDSIVLVDNAAPYYQDRSAWSTWVIPPPLLVNPGSVEVEFNVTWAGGYSVVLQIGVPNDAYNETYLYARESGHAFHLRTTWEMTDPGHSVYSYWRTVTAIALAIPCKQYTLGVVNPLCPYTGGQAGWDSTANAYGFHLRVTLHKGVLPLEPAHPDHWGAQETLSVIASETQEVKRYCFACPIAYQDDDSAQAYVPTRGYHGTTSRAYNATWGVKGRVPFETQWLDLTLHASRSYTGAGNAPWRLYARDATTTTFGDCDPYSEHNRAVGRAAQVHSQDPTGRTWTWRIPVTLAAADAPYAKSSNWCFYVAPADQNAYTLDDYEQQYGQVPRMELALSVNAHKDPIPKF